MTKMKKIHVAVGVIQNDCGEVLIALRQTHQHQGDLWEFPGGKLEFGESANDALSRELYEELAIRPRSAQPLLMTSYDYSELSVLLDVWLVDDFEGEALGQEGQKIEWRAIKDLVAADFPAANVPIINALKLRMKT